MCGRYQRRSDIQKIAEAFHLGNVDGFAVEFAPDYNAAPQSMQPVIIWDEDTGMRTLHMMFWRFLPPSVTEPKKFALETFNAKGETLLDSKTWRYSFLTRRCLVPADSFIEWKRIDEKTKLPWMFAMKDDKLFALGGVWRHWWSLDRKTQMDTFAIITTEPNELLAEKTGHDRMPVIITPADYQRWLQPGDATQSPLHLIRPFDSEQIKAWRVHRRINNVQNNDASLSEPLKDDDNEQPGIFTG